MNRLFQFCVLLCMFFVSACSSGAGSSVPSEARRLLELQEKCGSQARAEFDSAGFEKYDFVTLTNHYNQKLDKCFTQLNSMDARVAGDLSASNSVFVIDAFDGKSYGEFSAQRGKTAPSKCKVLLLSGQETTCHSEREFKAAIAQYME